MTGPAPRAALPQMGAELKKDFPQRHGDGSFAQEIHSPVHGLGGIITRGEGGGGGGGGGDGGGAGGVGWSGKQVQPPSEVIFLIPSSFEWSLFPCSVEGTGSLRWPLVPSFFWRGVPFGLIIQSRFFTFGR